jgi:hypothetical protein
MMASTTAMVMPDMTQTATGSAAMASSTGMSMGGGGMSMGGSCKISVRPNQCIYHFNMTYSGNR